MAHLRQRHCEAIFHHLLKYSPIVGFFGHRQVGKTTFCEHQEGHYETLDQKQTRKTIQDDPDGFVSKLKGRPVYLDECQLEPELFPALKDYVRVHPAPGKFVLTGSVRFSSRRAIRESLTGRMVSVEVLPMVLSELEPRPLPDTVVRLMTCSRFDAHTEGWMPDVPAQRRTQKTFAQFLTHGGLPKIAFCRDSRTQNDLMNDLISTILDRDLRMVLETKLSLEVLKKFVRVIARSTGQVWNASQIRRETGLAFETQKNLLFALESIFLIRRIPLIGRRGFLVFLEDQFEEYFLSGGELAQDIQISSAFFRNSRAQFNYRSGAEVQFSSYLTPDGAKVPLVIQGVSPQLRGTLGFHFLSQDSGNQPTMSQIRSTNSFLRKFPEAKVIYASFSLRSAQVLDSRSLMASLVSLL